MLLTSGQYYRLADGQVVRVQSEAGGLLSAYSVEGSRIHQCEESDHVNGWEPVGVNEWDKARKALKSKQAKAKKKVATKKAPKKGAKEESNEKAPE